MYVCRIRGEQRWKIPTVKQNALAAQYTHTQTSNTHAERRADTIWRLTEIGALRKIHIDNISPAQYQSVVCSEWCAIRFI